jgi:hypothetical protein
VGFGFKPDKLHPDTVKAIWEKGVARLVNDQLSGEEAPEKVAKTRKIMARLNAGESWHDVVGSTRVSRGGAVALPPEKVEAARSVRDARLKAAATAVGIDTTVQRGDARKGTVAWTKAVAEAIGTDPRLEPLRGLVVHVESQGGWLPVGPEKAWVAMARREDSKGRKLLADALRAAARARRTTAKLSDAGTFDI